MGSPVSLQCGLELSRVFSLSHTHYNPCNPGELEKNVRRSLCASLRAQSNTLSYDTANGLGSGFHELVHGVDCPWHASFLDQAAFVDRDSPQEHPQSLCLWEQDTGIPLRRHYTQARTTCTPAQAQSSGGAGLHRHALTKAL